MQMRDGRRLSRRDRRLHRRRLEFRRHRVSLPRRAIARRPEAPHRRGRAGRLPELTRGKYAYDFGDTAHLTPLVKMHTLGSTFMPPGFHAGGLRYHGMAPLVSHAQGARPDRGARLSPEDLLRRRRAVRARRGHRAGAGGEPRRAGRHRRGAALQGGRQVARRSCSTCAATAISTCRPTSTTSPASWSTATTTRRNWRWRSPGCPASRPDERHRQPSRGRAVLLVMRDAA